MAKRIVEESSLVSVANAIRTKGGTTGSFVFPDGFVTAIGNIQSGTNYLPGLVDGSITKVTADMLEGCKMIRGHAFNGCVKLTSVVIPSSVHTISTRAFEYCTKLATVEIKRTKPPTFVSDAFFSCRALTKIIVPAGTLSAYQSATDWSKYADIMVEASA